MTSTVMRNRGQKVFVGLVVAGVLLTVGGLVGASFVKSPADVASAQKAPPPDVLTAEVTHQKVSSTIITRGTVAARREISFTPESAWGATRMVVSARPPRVGSRVRSGDLLTQVSGRPVFVLIGGVPAYRDLRSGDTGTDVAQLRAALAAAGYSSAADRAGTFGSATASAVTRFYAAHGVRVATTGGDQIAPQGEADTSAGSAGSSKALSSAPAASTVLVPMSELFFVSSLPAVLTRFDGGLGSTVQAPLAAVQSGQLAVEVRLDVSDRDAVEVGQQVEIEDTETGKARPGGVVAVGAPVTPGASEDGGAGGDPYVPLRVRTDRPLPASAVGADVKVTIVKASTRRAVTAVPVAAVMTGADGGNYVVLVNNDGAQTKVPVRTGVVGEGIVAVDAADRLRAGQRVVVGA